MMQPHNISTALMQERMHLSLSTIKVHGQVIMLPYSLSCVTSG